MAPPWTGETGRVRPRDAGEPRPGADDGVGRRSAPSRSMRAAESQPVHGVSMNRCDGRVRPRDAAVPRLGTADGVGRSGAPSRSMRAAESRHNDVVAGGHDDGGYTRDRARSMASGRRRLSWRVHRGRPWAAALAHHRLRQECAEGCAWAATRQDRKSVV